MTFHAIWLTSGTWQSYVSPFPLLVQIKHLPPRRKILYIPSDKFGVWVVPPLVATQAKINWFAAAIDDAFFLADE